MIICEYRSENKKVAVSPFSASPTLELGTRPFLNLTMSCSGGSLVACGGYIGLNPMLGDMNLFFNQIIARIQSI